MSKDDISFEKALSELENIVETMEGGELSLDELLGKFEKGIGLLRACENILAQAEGRIEVLTKAQIEATEPATKTETESVVDTAPTEEAPPQDDLPWAEPKKPAPRKVLEATADDLPPLPEPPPEESLF